MEVETGGYESPTPWDDPTWRQDALDWIGDELAAAGTPPVDLDAIVVRARPWSVVIRIPVTTGDDVWFKANPPSSAFEPALMAALAAWTPAHVLRPIAVDVRKSWSLLPDGGPLLSAPSAASWVEPLKQYAELQLATADRISELIDIGLPDLRPEVIVDRFDDLLAEVGDRDGMAEIVKLRPRIVDWAAELASSGVPPRSTIPTCTISRYSTGATVATRSSIGVTPRSGTRSRRSSYRCGSCTVSGVPKQRPGSGTRTSKRGLATATTCAESPTSHAGSGRSAARCPGCGSSSASADRSMSM